MSDRERLSNVVSLATVLPGQDVEVVRVLLRDGATGDPHHRLRARRLWRCTYSGAVSMLLVSPTGETIGVSRDAARYVQVSTVEPAMNAHRSSLSSSGAHGRT